MKNLGEGAHRQGLGESRHALEQHVPAGEQADQQPLHHRGLSDQPAPDLLGHAAERNGFGGGLVGARRGWAIRSLGWNSGN